MYAVTVCHKCSKYRMIDMSSSTTGCPYCGTKQTVKESKILFKDQSQESVREAFAEITGFIPQHKEEKKEDSDPMTTLAYRYEHCDSINEKLDVLASGLTDILGTFTLNDIQEIDYDNGEEIIDVLTENCMVTEVSPGRYRSI